ncbi:hypothetical protein GLW36_15270 [Halorubrum terrestre]|uniref:Uncharacterized protein n=1 Tax=Halorubrum distributum TaxID=29283 RepID=A0A6B1IFF2_9EURY|nr:hypothetical protein [Halorubrum terrestre]MYL17999.1 hypothetical protein [Halorubrum terrestre]
MSGAALSPEEISRELIKNRHTEQEVASLIHDIEGHPDVDWVPLGREPNNYSIVENQQADAMAAFTELVVNSIDAIILRSFFSEFGDDYTGEEFSSLDEAAEELVEQDRDDIEVIAAGEQNGPYSLTLYDNGCGQPRGRFEHTFLNVLTPGELKQEFDFLQGKYGMGSTGVLPFCGEKGYKMIASAGFNSPNEWSWSIIRKNREKTRYEYLVVDGQPPQFDGEILDRDRGTFVKCFEYQNEFKSTITKRFRHRLERYVTESPVEIQLTDTRYDGWGDANTKGLLPSIDDRRKLLEGVDRIEHTFENDVLGTKDIEIYLFKDEDQLEEIGLSKGVKEAFVTGTKQTEQAILFTYNGQTHGDQGQTFIQRRCNLRRISNDTLVVIDFTDINDADVVDLFKPSRDRLQNKRPSKVLKSELEEIISENEMLRDEEERRKSKDIKEDSEELEEDILDDLLERNPSLKGYLKAGDKAPVIDESGDDEVEYDGNFYPSKFNIIKSYRSRGDYQVWDEEGEEMYVKRIPSNKSSLQRFELDAEDDFLSREKETGSVDAEMPSIIKSKRLKDGILSLRIDPPDAFSSGDNLTMKLDVNPADTPTGSLSQTFKVEITDPVEKTKRTTPKDDNSGSAGFELPDATWVPEEEWDRHEFNEHSIVRLEPSPDGEMTLFINEDAAPLVNFRKRNSLKKSGKEYVRKTYKLGVILYSVGQYMEIEREYGEDPRWEEIDPAQVVQTSMKGIAESLLDQTITDDKLKEITY